ncbi:uncharacterized protein BXZ73DRAFT_90342 [Epithele typhae]|uniref:uncharacterized protein n=1 Tax=Epithele typhae TaxID=378194 RepID=UPI002008CF17|nr:uncharacterized protein BXZ73DRAFT_90342 [Epithele typhae]KAH9929874.1 hypothetical protein BXZ73DRAFT_90342 [Epithele typhae]
MFTIRHDLPKPLLEALQSRRSAVETYNKIRGDIIHQCRLNFDDPTSRADFIETRCRTVYVDRLAECYPPEDHWVADTPEIAKLWRDHCRNSKLHDKREGRFPIFTVDQAKLIIAEADESILFRDAKTKELIGGVIRECCSFPGLVHGASQVAADACKHRKSVRKDDPGVLALVGFTAGSRSACRFDWAKNLLKPREDSAFKNDLRFREASICAFAWNMARGMLPNEVIESYDSFLHGTFIPRMNSSSDFFSKMGMYSVEDIRGPGGNVNYRNVYKFDAVELAPPSAVFSMNYSRRVHREGSPHQYVASWTINRPVADLGGNFFIPAFGIMIKSASNSLVFWKPKLLHCTSLRSFGTQEQLDNIYELGLTFATSPRLPSAWEKYVAANYSDEAAQELADEIRNAGHESDAED